VSPAKRGIERLDTERGTISNGVFTTFKLLRKIPARLSKKMVSGMKLLGIIDEPGSHIETWTCVLRLDD